TRLTISFGIFVALVFSIAALNLYMSAVLRDKLDASISYSRVLSFWKETDFAFARQRRTIDYYLMFATAAERESFNTQGLLIIKKMDDFLERGGPDSEGKDITAWRDSYRDYASWVNKMFATQTAAETPIKYFEQRVEPLMKALSEDISSRINDYSRSIEAVENDIAIRTRKSFMFSVTGGLAALLLAIYLSVSLFRSISLPIRMLERGAEIIGAGDLTHIIVLNNAPPELKTLADNFNSMVTNLAKLQLQVVQMDRMSSIGQLSGGVAHEINNPLTGVLGQAQLLLEKLPEDSPYRPHIAKIESAAQRCRKIVRSLLDFSRDKNYNFTPTDMNQIVEETIELLSSELQSKSIVVTKKLNAVSKVLASPSHMHQVVLNVMTNAIHAMKERGGTLSVSTYRAAADVMVSIKDTGIGIRKEHINHIFDPFFTTKDIGQGTGLGLTICYGIVQKHSGVITASSDGENKGAEIIIRLPIAKT
ncbi:MAG: HAMP domain-containing sensor histidine kinase, partial [Endomicrobiia bacterium]|nr:HAMP domain-containing sensor histidine kinase [Endomicrobiia bacterium]